MFQIQITDLPGAKTGTAEIDTETAWALAQFVKRCSWATCERLATSPEETQRMINAICALQRALREANISPR
jgi:hypothetical protein